MLDINEADFFQQFNKQVNTEELNILNTVLQDTCAAILLLFCAANKNSSKQSHKRTNWLSE